MKKFLSLITALAVSAPSVSVASAWTTPVTYSTTTVNETAQDVVNKINNKTIFVPEDTNPNVAGTATQIVLRMEVQKYNPALTIQDINALSFTAANPLTTTLAPVVATANLNQTTASVNIQVRIVKQIRSYSGTVPPSYTVTTNFNLVDVKEVIALGDHPNVGTYTSKFLDWIFGDAGTASWALGSQFLAWWKVQGYEFQQFYDKSESLNWTPIKAVFEKAALYGNGVTMNYTEHWIEKYESMDFTLTS